MILFYVIFMTSKSMFMCNEYSSSLMYYDKEIIDGHLHARDTPKKLAMHLLHAFVTFVFIYRYKAEILLNTVQPHQSIPQSQIYKERRQCNLQLARFRR